MNAYLLPDGRWLVPKRAEGEGGLVGDAMVVVGADDPEAKRWLAYYERQGQKPPRADKDGRPLEAWEQEDE